MHILPVFLRRVATVAVLTLSLNACVLPPNTNQDWMPDALVDTDTMAKRTYERWFFQPNPTKIDIALKESLFMPDNQHVLKQQVLREFFNQPNPTPEDAALQRALLKFPDLLNGRKR